VAIATTDERSFEGFDFEHDIQDTYVGGALPTAGDDEFVVGILDTGAIFDFASGSHADMLGLTEPMFTGELFGPISGAGGEPLFVPVTYPLGFFAGGLSSVNGDGTLNHGAMVGHSNVSVAVLPAIACGGGELALAVVGTAFVTFFDTVIRVDTPRTLNLGGRRFSAPDVLLGSALAPGFAIAHSVSMLFSGAFGATTASYAWSIDDQETPAGPTMLSPDPTFFFPLGGAYFETIRVAHGNSGERIMRVLVDSGSQSSIITPGLVSDLSLPFEPDFFAEVCGIGGQVSDVPGYYIDYVKIDAQGGALEFSRAPFVVLDVGSPDLQPIGGVLGMNFFWNRNIRMRLSLTGDSFLDLSAPIPVPYADSDVDFDVDGADYAFFTGCLAAPPLPPECIHLDVGDNGTVGLVEFSQFQLCHSGPGVTADPNCAPLAQ